jgi:hypothetical protein
MILRLANFFQTTARFGILVLGFTMVSIAIFSGALRNGITIANILSHLPDALPWFLLLFTLMLAWEYELIGGLIILVLGLGGLYYFQASSIGLISEVMLMWVIISFALMFILSWAIRQVHALSYT